MTGPEREAKEKFIARSQGCQAAFPWLRASAGAHA